MISYLSSRTCARSAGGGRAAFIELFHAGETAGLSIPILAGQVARRIVPLVLFGAAVLISVPKADLDLNRLQSFWA